jgi:hypothetical protein
MGLHSPPMTPAPALTAVCPLHPERESVATCTRCGRFMCIGCQAVDEPPVCESCAPLFIDPLQIKAAHFSLWNTARNGLRMWSAVLPKVLLITTAFSIPGGLLSYAVATRLPKSTRSFGNLYDALIGTIGAVACIALFIGVAEGRTLTLGEAIAESLSRWGRVFGARVRTGLWTALFLILLVVPGIWKSITLIFSVEAAVRVPRGDALEMSAELVKERWWAVAVTSLLVQFGALAPGFALTGILEGIDGVVGVPLIARVVFENWIFSVGATLASACMLSAYYGLNRANEITLQPMRWVSQPKS